MSIHSGSLEGYAFDAATIERDMQGRAAGDEGAPCRTGFYRRHIKRFLDLMIILAFSWLIVPVVAILCLLVMLDGRSPFYTQERVGRGGRVFRMWKLRSMVPQADARLEEHLIADPAARIEWDATQKLKHDPRITRVGRLIRKSSMDELPQLWNVVTGDMSLVGPRPMMPCQRDLYAGRSYYVLRPGITGFWQISDRNQCDFGDRALFDRAYDRALSFRTDLSVLVRTIAVVLRGTGY